jgi:hypothetical protein
MDIGIIGSGAARPASMVESPLSHHNPHPRQSVASVGCSGEPLFK